MKTSTLLAIILGLALFSPITVAACKRYVPSPPGSPPDIDGPGSWGPLHDTLTRDCLVFKGVVHHNETIALLEDEEGRIYKVKRGDFVGENSGRIEQISADRIHLIELLPDGKGGWVESPCYIFLGQNKRAN